jgi:hypothetical protein
MLCIEATSSWALLNFIGVISCWHYPRKLLHTVHDTLPSIADDIKDIHDCLPDIDAKVTTIHNEIPMISGTVAALRDTMQHLTVYSPSIDQWCPITNITHSWISRRPCHRPKVMSSPVGECQNGVENWKPPRQCPKVMSPPLGECRGGVEKQKWVLYSNITYHHSEANWDDNSEQSTVGDVRRNESTTINHQRKCKANFISLWTRILTDIC